MLTYRIFSLLSSGNGIVVLYGHFSLILLGEMVINRNSSWRNKTFLSPLLLSLETTRRLCRRVVSEALPAIFPYNKPV